MSAQALVVDFSKIDKNDTPLVGGKCANLGEMVKAGFPVPPGFAVTIHGYDQFLEENKIVEKIYSTLESVDVDDPNQLNDASSKIKKLILRGQMPEELGKEIISYYKKLSGFMKNAYVAVRSSATAEDAPGTSFAGQQETFLNVKGEANLLEKVKGCWASLFTARSIFYRVKNKIKHENVKVSVAVQKMIQSEVSGVMFSIDPVKNEKDKIVIEAVWGLGEMIVQGSVVPDKYVVQKETFAILSKEISEQRIYLTRSGEKTFEKKVPQKIIENQKITNEEIIELAKYSDKLQKHYFFPQDSEWAKEKGKLYIVQTRPVTTVDVARPKKSDKQEETATPQQYPLLTGTPASPGIGTGPVKVLASPKQIQKVSQGDVLVAPMTSPDYVPAMKKASAIITDQGGQTSHAAIVSRELGIPCVVGTQKATQLLKEGMIVSVNGENGEIYKGQISSEQKEKLVEKPKKSSRKLRTATKVYVNLAEADRVKEISKMNVDGIGLLRAEFMIAGIGIHPKEAIKRKQQDKFIKKLTENLEVFCKAFNPRPVVYRATDFKTNEYRSLPGGKFWEPEEPNPMLGFRGASRYIASPEVFNLELTAILNVRKKYKNLHLMIPFVRSPQELVKVRRLVSAEGLFNDHSFKFWMMVEIPVNVIQIEDFIRIGIDGVSIGSNDLTMLIQGTDRDNSEVAGEFNERSPSVLWSLRRVIKKCSAAGVTTSICGQAPSEYEDLVEKLVKWGVTSVSVNPDAIARTRQVIHDYEQNI